MSKGKVEIMHVQLMIRGIYSQCELWKSMAQSQFFKWRRTNIETNEEELILFQGALRPSAWGTYEYIIPDTALPEFLSMVAHTDDKAIHSGQSKKKMVGLALMRKMCGVQKIPKKIYKESQEKAPTMIWENSERGLHGLQVHGVCVHVIGIKKDKYGKMFDPKTNKTYHQELL